MQSIKVGDQVKCFVRTTKKQGGKAVEVNTWVYGVVYHVGDTVLAFETDNGHIYGVKIESVSLA